MRERWILGGIALIVVAAIGVFSFQRERRADVVAREPEATSSPEPDAIVPSLVVPSETPADPVEPAVDPTRSPVSTTPEVVAAGRAALVVRAVAADTLAPIQNATIGFYRKGGDETATPFTEEWYREFVESSAKFSEEYYTVSGSDTDANGIVELSVPAGKSFTIQCSSDDPSLVQTRLEIPALAPDERREVTLEVGQGGFVFLGRIVEREGEAPVHSAIVTLVDDEDDEVARTESDASGAFSFRVASFDHDRVVRIEAPGFAVAFGDLSEGHERPGEEALFRLSRSATLFGRVSLANGTASPGSTVLALAKRAHLKQPAGVAMPVWGDDEDVRQGAITDDGGSYRLEGLPPSVRLQIVAFVEDESLTSDIHAITLAAGEERELSVILEPAPVLDVLVVDERGAPIPGLDLWLAKESWTSSGRAAMRYFDSDEDPEVQVTSDESGRCRIDSIAGPRFLGPAPGPSQTGFGTLFSLPTQKSGAEDREYPAVGQPIVVRAGEQEITLSLKRGLPIEGRVVDAEGRPVPWELIDCRSDDYGWVPGARSDSDGKFQTDLLADGDYRLKASGGSLGDSTEVTARAGEQDVLLALVSRPTCTVRGRVSGIEGGRDISVRACPLSRPHWMSGTGVDNNGEFELSGLEAGTYRLSAESEDGRFGLITGIDVRPGIEPVHLELRPGARLVVRCETDAPFAGIEVYRDGILVTESIALEGSSPAIVVPPGDLEVRLFLGISLAEEDWGQPSQAKTVSVKPGDERELDFP